MVYPSGRDVTGYALVHHEEDQGTHDVELHGRGQEPGVQQADLVRLLEVVDEQDVHEPGVPADHRDNLFSIRII